MALVVLVALDMVVAVLVVLAVLAVLAVLVVELDRGDAGRVVADLGASRSTSLAVADWIDYIHAGRLAAWVHFH